MHPRIVDAKEMRGPQTYAKLRAQALSLTPKMLGMPDGAPRKTLALLMETTYGTAVVTLVVLADDTVSLYFSNGGGMIGMGAHAEPAEAGGCLLKAAESHVDSRTKFIAITSEGLRAEMAPEEELGNNRHPLSPLFPAAHEVITQIRLQSEKRQARLLD